jgi:hypothetical protein
VIFPPVPPFAVFVPKLPVIEEAEPEFPATPGVFELLTPWTPPAPPAPTVIFNVSPGETTRVWDVKYPDPPPPPPPRFPFEPPPPPPPTITTEMLVTLAGTVHVKFPAANLYSTKDILFLINPNGIIAFEKMGINPKRKIKETMHSL